MTLLLKSATILDADQPDLHGKKQDLLIEKGVITRIGRQLKAPAGSREIRLENLHVSAGWVDTGVSFGEPGHEERETVAHGLEVAAGSGFTAVILNPDTKPLPDTSGDIVFLKDLARNSLCELFPAGTLSKASEGSDLAELFDMQGAGAVTFHDYKTPVANPNLLRLALEYAQGFGGLVQSFPMDAALGHNGQMHEGAVSVRLGLRGIPGLSEELQVVRDLAILEYTGGKLHIPLVSTARAVKHISDAKKRGLDVSCSVAIHNLAFSDANLEAFESRYKVLPPLRPQAECNALIKGLSSGVIDFVTSDHNPRDIEEKRLEFDRAAFGTLGLEAAFGTLNRLLGSERAIDLLTRGRKRFGLPEVKLAEGQKACLTLFNPDGEREFTRHDIRSTATNCLYVGARVKGNVYGVIRGGKTNIR